MGIGKIIKTVVTAVGEEASEPLQQYRYNTCLQCTHLIKATKQCDLCLCFVEAKAALKNQQCPDEPRRW